MSNLIYDPKFGKWLKKNNYIIVVNENNKKSKHYMKKFGNNETIKTLPLVSSSSIKKTRLTTPNIYVLKKGRYHVVHKQLTTPVRRLNRLYRDFKKLQTIFSLGFGREFSTNDLIIDNSKGKNSFDKIPKSIYKSKGGNVFDFVSSPYAGNKVNWRPPRPFGPRDQAMIKYNNFGQFKPQPKKTWKPLKSKEIQVSNCFDINKGKVSIKHALGYGPNNVAYRKPFLLYKGNGSNTINFSTNKTYLPSKKIYKVQKNNNSNGWLSGNEVKRLKNLYGNHNLLQFDSDVYGTGARKIAQPLKLYNEQQKSKTVGEGDTLIISDKGVTVKKR